MYARRVCVFLSLLVTSSINLSVVHAARPLVSSNPHAQNLPTSTPPLNGIARIPCTNANAYHVGSNAEVTRALGYSNYNKPKILSDDSLGVSATQAKDWIWRACNAGEHYEHYDAALASNANSAVMINSLSDFPTASQDVLTYIRDASCASNLSPGGVLSQNGTDFLWGGNVVNLVGHSWMGAVAGDNFNFEGYLNVLANHRVNLTRIWVVEQWTGLAVGHSQQPVFGNSWIPFDGAVENGDVELAVINEDYLNRIETFVKEAHERGIVVQVTLFDRHGLLNQPSQWGRFKGSPYNKENNEQTHGQSLFQAGNINKAPSNFVDLCWPTYTQSSTNCPIQRTHFDFIKKLRERLKDEGNVIFEIMNEPLSSEWGTMKVTKFHRWVADAVLREGAEKVGFGCFQ